MTARTTSDIDIAVPTGSHGYGILLEILFPPSFIQERSGTVPQSSYYFRDETNDNLNLGVLALFLSFLSYFVLSCASECGSTSLNEHLRPE